LVPILIILQFLYTTNTVILLRNFNNEIITSYEMKQPRLQVQIYAMIAEFHQVAS